MFGKNGTQKQPLLTTTDFTMGALKNVTNLELNFEAATILISPALVFLILKTCTI